VAHGHITINGRRVAVPSFEVSTADEVAVRERSRNMRLAVVVAMLTAGLFEYNFGDSEFLMLFLVLVPSPFAAHRNAHLGRGTRLWVP